MENDIRKYFCAFSWYPDQFFFQTKNLPKLYFFIKMLTIVKRIKKKKERNTRKKKKDIFNKKGKFTT